MNIAKTPFTVFDFETTGLYPYSGDRICEIGAIRFGPRKGPKKRFHTLVNPMRSVSPGAFSVNGITDDMLCRAPRIEDVLPRFLKFIEGSVLVAYNAGFDLGFLESALGNKKKELDSYYVVDALALARRLFPGAKRYALGVVSEHLGIRVKGEHRAMADAVMTLEIFEKELALLAKEGIKTVKDIAYVRTHKPVVVKRVKDYKLKLIEDAIRDEKKLNIVYRSVWTDQVTNRTIAPREIQEGYDRSYVVAYCHMMKADRNFRLDGILEVEEA